MMLRVEFIDTETITMYKKLLCERYRYIYILWYLKIRGYLQYHIYTASIYG